MQKIIIMTIIFFSIFNNCIADENNYFLSLKNSSILFVLIDEDLLIVPWTS